MERSGLLPDPFGGGEMVFVGLVGWGLVVFALGEVVEEFVSVEGLGSLVGWGVACFLGVFVGWWYVLGCGAVFGGLGFLVGFGDVLVLLGEPSLLGVGLVESFC